MAETTGNTERNNEGKRKGGGKAVGLIALLAALLGGGGYFGLGIGNPGGGLLPGSQSSAPAVTADATQEVTQEATQEVTQAPSTAEQDSILSIVVRENGILYEGRSISLAELETALLSDLKDGFTVELSDDHASKADYEAVETLLGKLSVPFTVK